MSVSAGTHNLGPDSGTLQVKTYRDGMASKLGHDLTFEVTKWEATVTVAEDGALSSIELSADPHSLEVRDATGGAKDLSDKDRAEEIPKSIDDKVLEGEPISFSSTEAQLAEDDGTLSASGELTMAGDTHPVSAELSVDSEGHVTGTIALTQSDWGIKPFKAMMGALKVKDEVDVLIDARLPSS
ncbi:MAG: YceI family protein [Solirubrobacteraceae bacterium]